MKLQQNQAAPTTSSRLCANFGRRLGAIFYDLLLLIAMLMVAALPFVLIAGDTHKNFSTRSGFQLYLVAVIFFYYTGFWIHGQTLGLRTWKLRLVAANGGPVTWTLASKRFAAALLSIGCLGLGFLWALIDREKLAWHDRLSGTRLIRLPSDVTAQQK